MSERFDEYHVAFLEHANRLESQVKHLESIVSDQREELDNVRSTALAKVLECDRLSRENARLEAVIASLMPGLRSWNTGYVH